MHSGLLIKPPSLYLFIISIWYRIHTVPYSPSYRSGHPSQYLWSFSSIWITISVSILKMSPGGICVSNGASFLYDTNTIMGVLAYSVRRELCLPLVDCIRLPEQPHSSVAWPCPPFLVFWDLVLGDWKWSLVLAFQSPYFSRHSFSRRKLKLPTSTTSSVSENILQISLYPSKHGQSSHTAGSLSTISIFILSPRLSR
jgi:hypothetical protein